MTARHWDSNQLWTIYKIADLTQLTSDAEAGSDERSGYLERTRAAIFAAETQAFVGRDDVKPLLRAAESGATKEEVYAIVGAPHPDAHKAPEEEASA